jgi:hypothetical protein
MEDVEVMPATDHGILVLCGWNQREARMWAVEHAHNPDLVRTSNSPLLGFAFAAEQVVIRPDWLPTPREEQWFWHLASKMASFNEGQAFIEKAEAHGLTPPWK